MMSVTSWQIILANSITHVVNIDLIRNWHELVALCSRGATDLAVYTVCVNYIAVLHVVIYAFHVMLFVSAFVEDIYGVVVPPVHTLLLSIAQSISLMYRCATSRLLEYVEW